MKLSDLEHAAFWGGQVCLSCGWASSDGEEVNGECPECGSKHIATAEEALKFVKNLEGESNGNPYW